MQVKAVSSSVRKKYQIVDSTPLKSESQIFRDYLEGGGIPGVVIPQQNDTTGNAIPPQLTEIKLNVWGRRSHVWIPCAKKNMSFIQILMSDKSYFVCNVDMLDCTKPYNTVSLSHCYSLKKGQWIRVVPNSTCLVDEFMNQARSSGCWVVECYLTLDPDL